MRCFEQDLDFFFPCSVFTVNRKKATDCMQSNETAITQELQTNSFGKFTYLPIGAKLNFFSLNA